MNVYGSDLIARKLPCPKKFLVTRLVYIVDLIILCKLDLIILCKLPFIENLRIKPLNCFKHEINITAVLMFC